MREVPVVGVLAALLGEVRTGAGRAQQDRLVHDVVTGLGDALRPQAPVDGSDGLAVAVDAAVGDVERPAPGLHGTARAEDLRGLLDPGGPGHVDHHENDGRQKQQAADDNGHGCHLHWASPGLKYKVRRML